MYAGSWPIESKYTTGDHNPEPQKYFLFRNWNSCRSFLPDVPLRSFAIWESDMFGFRSTTRWTWSWLNPISVMVILFFLATSWNISLQRLATGSILKTLWQYFTLKLM